jgi:hypothetical protein
MHTLGAAIGGLGVLGERLHMISSIRKLISTIRKSSTVALLLSPVGVLIIAAARLLIIANYDMNSALAILTSTGYVNTLLGTVFPLIPALLPWLGLVLLWLNRMVESCLAFVAAVLISPATMSRASTEALLLHEWHQAIGGSYWRDGLLAILAIPTAILLLLLLVSLGPKGAVRPVGTIAIIALLPLMIRLYPVPLSEGFYTDILRRPWLPAEAITLATHETFIGYKLDDSDGNWMEVLREDDHSVRYYRLGAVTGRQLCQLSGIGSGRPIVALLASAPGSPDCSSLARNPASASTSANTFPESWALTNSRLASGPVIDKHRDLAENAGSGQDK